MFSVIMVFAFSSCFSEKLPEENPENTDSTVFEENPEEIKEEIPGICEEIVLNLGAEKAENGKIYTPKFGGFFEGGSVPDFSSLEQKYYFSWLHNYFYKIYGEKREELFPTLHEKDYGLSYPAEEYEKYAMQFFGVSKEHLREEEYFYCKEHNAYCTPDYFGFGGDGNNEVKILSAKESQDSFYVIALEIFFGEEGSIYELTVLINEDGTYRYISYLPYSENEVMQNENDTVCREIVLSFGAMENAAGELITPKGQPTAFDCDFFEDASEASAETYFYWMFHFMPENTKSTYIMDKRAAFFESTDFIVYTNKFFEADMGYLRSLDIYDEYDDIFIHETQQMHFGAPLEVLSYSVDRNIMEINIRRILCDGEETVDSVLRAEFYGIGDFKYLSYLEKID